MRISNALCNENGRIVTAPLGDDATEDQILAALNLSAVTLQRAKKQEADLYEWITEYLGRGGVLTDPLTKDKWYLGRDKGTKMKPGVTPGEIFDKALETNQGDLEETYKILSKGAIKYGAAKVLLGEAFFDRFWHIVHSVERKAMKPSSWAKRRKG